MKLYKFTSTVTTQYYFEVKAKNAADAYDRFAEMSNDEARGRKTLDITTELVGVEEIEEDYEEDEHDCHASPEDGCASCRKQIDIN